MIRSIQSLIRSVSITLAALSLAFAPHHASAQHTTTATATTTTAAEELLRTERHHFQSQQIITAQPFSTIFNPGTPPRLVWRDVDDVRRMLRDGVAAAQAAADDSSAPLLRVRWFDTHLDEITTATEPGRYGALVETISPNGTPVRRSYTFYCRPPMFLAYFFQNMPGVEIPYQDGPIPREQWAAHEQEIETAAKRWLIDGMNDSPSGAQLLANLSEETTPTGNRHLDSAAVRDQEFHLAMKLKAVGLNDRVRPLDPPRVLSVAEAKKTPALRRGTPSEAGVARDAKKRIDTLCGQWARAEGEPFVTLVARRGVIITHEAFGVDPKTSRPISRDYRCDVASITKTISAMLFSLFVDQKRVALDDPVSVAFPDYPTTGPLAAHVPTFRQCFTHTSGLSGHGSFGGVANPHLENVILNGIDAIHPNRAYIYTGTGFDLAGKAMEMLTGKSAARVFHDHLFAPLGIPDARIDGMGSGFRPTAWELSVLAQWLCNRGSYGDKEFILRETFDLWLPEPVGNRCPGVTEEYGIGMRWMRDCKPGTPADSTNTLDLILSKNTIGHGSLSQCMLQVDLDNQLVVVQIRNQGTPNHGIWARRFLQTVVETIKD